jgi:hypothetical protein
VGHKRILFSASIGVFLLIIIMSPINTHMHRLLLGGGVFFGGPVLFGCVTMTVAQQSVGAFFSWVRLSLSHVATDGQLVLVSSPI